MRPALRGLLGAVRRGSAAPQRCSIAPFQHRSFLNMHRGFSSTFSPATSDQSDNEDNEAEEEESKPFDSEEVLVKWDPHLKNPLELTVTFEDVSMAVYKIRSGKFYSM
jgi:hypothetical protein